MTYQGAQHARSNERERILTRPAATRRRWISVAGFLAATALALSGCGSSDDSSSATASASATSTATGVSGVVGAANAFLKTLSDDQKKSVQHDFTKEDAVKWSNLPCADTCREGIQFGTLNATQLAAAKLVLQKAMGTVKGSGYDQAMQILKADDILDTAQSSQTAEPGGAMPSGGMPSGGMPSGAAPSGMPTGMPTGGNGQMGLSYNSGLYYLAFLGTPSTTDSWHISFGGHHLAVNLTYEDGKVTGTTPFFIGVEPKTWTDSSTNTTYAPLQTMHDGMAALLKGLTSDELATAKLSQSFSDVLLGPGKDGDFPATKVGLKVSSLTAAQKQLVLNAIKPWVQVAADSDAATILKEYENDLDQTYIAWSGQSTLTHHADYVRVDGPGVWVEFVCQDGVVYRDQIHYHTVYRDHTRDYGGEFSF